MASPSTATSPQSADLPTRSATASTDDAIPDEDSSEVTKLFHERLQAWKHACVYFEDYVEATSKMYSSASKDYEKVLKTVSSPLKEGHHFDQSLGGVAGLFDNIRSNTQGIQNSNTETSKTLKSSVLPIFERLHTEIKNKTKELSKGAGKGSKAVDKARNVSQKHIELLGQHTATFDSTGGSVKAGDDPYILQRQVYHRLNKQVQEENNNRDDMLSVQNSFSQFESHVLSTFTNGLAQFNQVVTNQTEQTRNMYGDMLGTVSGTLSMLFENQADCFRLNASHQTSSGMDLSSATRTFSLTRAHQIVLSSTSTSPTRITRPRNHLLQARSSARVAC